MIPLLVPEAMTEETIRNLIEANGSGIAIKNIPNQTYHDGPGYSSSDIKAVINGTVKAWRYAKANKKKQTPAMALGTAIHCMVLEPKEFWKRYILETDIPKAPPRNHKFGKDLWEAYKQEFKAEEMDSDEWTAAWRKWKHPSLEHLTVISTKDVGVCKGIAKSVETHPMVSQMFAEGESEVTIYWVDKDTNLLCKCRPDRLNSTFPCIPDLKSTQDAGLEAFEADITNHDYHVSAFWYLEGAKQAMGMDFENFVYIACEKEEPYQVAFYTADEGSLSIAEGLCRAGLEIIKEWETKRANPEMKDEWDGYSLEPKSAGVRPWAFNKLSQVIHAHDLHGRGLEKFVGVV